MNQLAVLLLSLSISISGTYSAHVQDSTSHKSSHPKMTITEVLQKHTTQWMEIPGVSGTGEGKSSGKPCIMVFIDHKSEVIKKKVPKTVDGYKVVLEVTGEIKAY
jgi:hypothetical protein